MCNSCFFYSCLPLQHKISGTDAHTLLLLYYHSYCKFFRIMISTSQTTTRSSA